MDPRYEEERTEVLPPEPPPPPPPWWREHWWWIFLVVLLLLVAGIIAYFALRDEAAGDVDRAIVPDVVGLQEAEARAELQGRGFAVEVVREEADEPEGVVFAQSPGAGSRLAEGQTVRIDVSTGEEEAQTTTVTETETVTQAETETEPAEPETATMPDAVGQDYRDAAEAVFGAGLVGDTYPVGSAEERGIVVAQNPAPGTELEAGSIVRLNVALGEGERSEREVPDVTGPQLAEAHAICRDAGFTCRTIPRDAPDPDNVGEVIDQRPAAGTSAPELTQITLFVGR